TSRSKFGYLCVEGMTFPTGEETADPDTGEIVPVRIPVLPSTYKCPQSGAALPWASLAGGIVHSGTASFRSGRYDGGGMRYLRFQHWLEQLADDSGGLAAIYFEEVRRHIGTDAAHIYGGFLATLTAW